MDIKDIKLYEVFRYFEEISKIPRGSGNVKMISDYLVAFADEHGLKSRQDDLYNVIIWKSASDGMEGSPTVIIQGHMDMVAVKTDECKKDMDTQGLDLAVDGDYLYAEGTSLGADDGIAIAYALALLESDDIKHPAIEAIFTVDEETGMYGALGLDVSDIKGRTMLNIDSEQEGVFTVGCAGGATVEYSIKAQKQKVKGSRADIRIDGLVGEHSGMQIGCQSANAIQMMGRLLYKISEKASVRIASVSGGEKDNAIAKFAECSFIHLKEDEAEIKNIIEEQKNIFRSEYLTTDKELDIRADFCDDTEMDVYSDKISQNITASIFSLPCGVLKYSYDIEGFVQTSVNKGVLTDNGNGVTLTLSVRSSVSSEKKEVTDKIGAFAKMAGADILVDGDYPAWEYVSESGLRDIMTGIYQKMYKKSPVIETIHAGVECGIIAEKLEGLDCVSFGPDIHDIHTVNERLSISSVERTWEFIKEILKNI